MALKYEILRSGLAGASGGLIKSSLYDFEVVEHSVLSTQHERQNLSEDV